MEALLIESRHIPSVKARNLARVCDLLHWTQDEYAAFVFNSGIQYLQLYTDNDESAISLISNHAPYWEWWKHLWFARDCGFIDVWDGLEDEVPRMARRVAYKDVHSVEVLVAEICLPRYCYPKGFAIVTKPINR